MESFDGFKDICVGQLLTRLAALFPHHEALVGPDSNRRWTFAELEEWANRLARGLLGFDVQKGDRVAVWSTNLPEWVALQFALAKIGAILVTVNTQLRAHELEYLLSQSESSILITARGFKDIDYIQTIDSLLPVLASTGRTDPTHPKLASLQKIISIETEKYPGFIPFGELEQSGLGVSMEAVRAREGSLHVDEIINMQYTSGTTGFPKGVMLSHRNILNNGYWLGTGLAYSPADRLCLSVPLFHCFGCVIGVLGAFTHGVAIVMVEYFDPLKVLEAIERERCTAVYGVPTMFLAMLGHPEFGKFNCSSLRTGIMAGAPCPEPLMRRVITEMHIPEMTIAYGMTESSPGITQTSRHDDLAHRCGTVGKALPEVEVKVIDPLTQQDTGPNEPGELCCRGYIVMQGYYNNPKETAKSIDEIGWLHTGDQASMDREGYVRVTGRLKDIIIRGGENIAPKEIEEFLLTHPKILDVAVYGIPNEQWGEEVAAAIRLKPRVECTGEEIQSYCKERIASFKIPTTLRFVESFPTTASGKVQKFKLKEMFAP
ncbi:MAG: AMP-binding protein [Acidobacteriia bacterium]|nr:AMP-binding protein [Terriglobia bacterium]